MLKQAELQTVLPHTKVLLPTHMKEFLFRTHKDTVDAKLLGINLCLVMFHTVMFSSGLLSDCLLFSIFGI